MLRKVAAAAIVLLLAGCGAIVTSIEKRDLDVQVKMSDSVFLDPLRPSERTVYVDIRNSSDRPDFDIAGAVRRELELRGFRVVDDPDQAHVLLQANILQVSRTSRSAADQALDGGFGGAVAGGAVGYGIGRAGGGNDTLLTIGGALAGAAIGAAIDASVQDTTYTVITDVQISERVSNGRLVSQTEEQNLPQGSAGTVRQDYAATTDWKRYRTRIVGTANRANLRFEEAAPVLVKRLTQVMAGVL